MKEVIYLKKIVKSLMAVSLVCGLGLSAVSVCSYVSADVVGTTAKTDGDDPNNNANTWATSVTNNNNASNAVTDASTNNGGTTATTDSANGTSNSLDSGSSASESSSSSSVESSDSSSSSVDDDSSSSSSMSSSSSVSSSSSSTSPVEQEHHGFAQTGGTSAVSHNWFYNLVYIKLPLFFAHMFK